MNQSPVFYQDISRLRSGPGVEMMAFHDLQNCLQTDEALVLSEQLRPVAALVPLRQNNGDLDAPPTTNNNSLLSGNQHPSSFLFFPAATVSSDGAKNQQCCSSILPFPVQREQRAFGDGAMQQNHGSGGLDSFFGLLLLLAATGKWCAGR
nr:hypothetical protein Itr_chr04CG10990 [Ipomoea trifida]